MQLKVKYFLKKEGDGYEYNDHFGISYAMHLFINFSLIILKKRWKLLTSFC